MSQSPLKYEWPYVQYLSREDVKSYQSTLPEDLNNIRVRQIVPTELWQRRNMGPFVNKIYLSPEDEQKFKEAERRSMLILGPYTLLLYASFWSMTKWYNSNVVRNYIYFKNESWPSYIKLRILPVACCAWTVLYAFSYQ